MLKWINKISEESGFCIVNIFYVGDGNLYLFVLFDVRKFGEIEKVFDVGSVCL